MSSLFLVVCSCAFSLSVAQLVYGVRYKGKGMQLCPIQPKLPLYLIVPGASGITVPIVYVIFFCLSMKFKCFHYIGLCITTIGCLFMISWLYSAHYWVFKDWNRITFDEENLHRFCDATLLWITVGSFGAANGLIAIVLIIVCCGLCGLLCKRCTE